MEKITIQIYLKNNYLLKLLFTDTLDINAPDTDDLLAFLTFCS